MDALAKTDSALRSPYAAPLAWAVAAIAAGSVTAPLDPNLLEEGIVVHTAERMMHGEHLYRDVWSHTAPLPYELLALLFRLFGAELWLARAAVVALQGVGTAALFATARRAGAGPLAHAAAACVAAAPVLLVPLFSIYFYTTLAFYLGLVALWLGDRGTRERRFAAATGVTLALVALCKQNTGVFLAATVTPAVALCAPRGTRAARALDLLLGGAGVTAATLLLYAARGDLEALLFAQIELPFAMARGETFRAGFINLWPPGQLDPAVRESWVMYLPSLYHLKYGLFAEIGRGTAALTQGLYVLPFASLGIALLRGATARPATAFWLHAAFLLSMTLNLFPRADWGHLVVSLPPALVQLLLCAAPVATRTPRARRASAAVAAALVVILAASTAGIGSWLHRVAGPARFGPRVPLQPVSRALRGPAVPRVIHYLRSHARRGEAIFVARQEPLLYFATETTNPTPFEGVLPGLRELQEPRILSALEEVRYVVLSDIDQPIYTYYAEELPGVQAYLERNFRVPRDFPLDDYSWIIVVRRVPDRGATAVDLIAERDAARFWVRDADGSERVVDREPPRLAARQLHRPFALYLGPRGGGADFEIEPPEDARFQAGVGYRGLVSVDHRYEHPPGTTFVVAVRREEDDAFDELARMRIDDSLRGGRRWRPVEVDLADYAGERVTLRLEVRARRPLPPGELAWWGSPRIAREP